MNVRQRLKAKLEAKRLRLEVSKRKDAVDAAERAEQEAKAELIRREDDLSQAKAEMKSIEDMIAAELLKDEGQPDGNTDDPTKTKMALVARTNAPDGVSQKETTPTLQEPNATDPEKDPLVALHILPGNSPELSILDCFNTELGLGCFLEHNEVMDTLEKMENSSVVKENPRSTA